MTGTIVVDSVKTVVDSAQPTTVVVTEVGKTITSTLEVTKIITSGMMPPNIVSSITNSVDIDISALQDGGTLVYSTATNKWVATNLLDKQIFEAGQF